MKLNTLQITSPEAFDTVTTITRPVCLFHGNHAELALDLIRELIGDYGAEEDPDRVDDGHFVLHSDIEMEGKHYNVCYIRNADFMGDNRIAANFVPNSFSYSEDDTVEFVDACNARDKDASNVLLNCDSAISDEDDRPLFVYHLDRMDDAFDPMPWLARLAVTGRQVFVSVCSSYPVERLSSRLVQVVSL